MRYQLIELLQLAFALGLIFAAFLGGVAIGWWRWGRDESSGTSGSQTAVATVSSDLFTPADPGRDEVVLSQPVFGADTGHSRRQLPAPAEPFA